MLVFPISMSRIANTQDAAHNWKHIEELAEKVARTEGIGLTILYSDYLYMHSSQDASEMRDKMLNSMLHHKRQFESLLAKHHWYIPRAFNFLTWGQAILQSRKPYMDCFKKLEKLYKENKEFRKCVHDDIKKSKRSTKDGSAVRFILDECVLLNLFQKGQIEVFNDYVFHHERWILFCYPGKPLKSEVWISQKNPFKLRNAQNRYEDSFYDLEGKKLYDYLKINLEKDASIFE